MAIDILRTSEQMQDDRERLIGLHFAAMEVVKNSRKLGPHDFDIKGLDDDQASVLQDYIAQYAGKPMELIEHDEDGQVVYAGTIPVTEDCSKFHWSDRREDPESGEVTRTFNWNPELWDKTAAEKEAKIKKQHRVRKVIGRCAAGVYLTIAGSMLLTGAHLALDDKGEINNQQPRTTTEETGFVTEENELGLAITLGGAFAIYALATPLTIRYRRMENARLEREEQRNNLIKGAFEPSTFI